MRRVVVTGMGGVTSLGQNWETVKAGLLAHRNAVRRMHEWDDIEGLNARLGAPVLDFTLPEHYTRKRIRSMGRVSLLSTRATELALEQAGLIDDPVIKSGRTGIAYGSCTGSTRAVADFGEMIVNRNTRGITATTYVQRSRMRRTRLHHGQGAQDRHRVRPEQQLRLRRHQHVAHLQANVSRNSNRITRQENFSPEMLEDPPL